jgi:hypothetical protein
MDGSKIRFAVSYSNETPFLEVRNELKLQNALPDEIAVLYVYQSTGRSVFTLDLCEWLIAYTDFLNQSKNQQQYHLEVDLLISAGKFIGRKIDDIIELTLWEKTKGEFEILKLEYANAKVLHEYLKDYYFKYVTNYFHSSPRVTGQEQYELN